jgi:hypothetical protein
MRIEDINDRMGDLTVELTKQFQAELIRLADDEEGLLGLMHEIAENPDMYFSMLGPKIVYLAVAHNEAMNSYISMDEIIQHEWEQSAKAPDMAEREEPLPPVTQDVIAFPTAVETNPLDHPDGDRHDRV